ncbi:MAG: cysteine dioxygenase family protein [Planctomycetota bacterium]|nr:cysteine dioxygenase family protein [Planctomycetota bacterium]
MSSVNRVFSKPASKLFASPDQAIVAKHIVQNLRNESSDDRFPGGLRLMVKGQGVVFGRLSTDENRNNKNGFEFRVDDRHLTTDGPSGPCGDTKHGFRFRITADEIILEVWKDNKWENICDKTTKIPLPDYKVQIRDDAGLDSDSGCCYWLSIDSHNRVLRYGKGEVRLGTMLAELRYPDAPTDPAHTNSTDPFEWVGKVEFVSYLSDIENVNFCPLKSFRDPVTTEPALYVLPVDAITMDDIAHNRATVAANLSETCQKLYHSVAGAKFQLNTPDFPNFSDAIEASIASPQGWCNKILAKKAGEFGQPNPDMTYLRITMGVNQGDSPGVPFVMEIWPPGHYSPVHNHAGANAIIRVLHGEITVNLYPMLSKSHLRPIGVAKFGKDDVTWISPDLNQTHQLRNTNVAGPTCITIQCYMYGEGDTEHYNYFDYLGDQGERDRFNPNSDMDYLSFKEQMKREWITWFNNH